MKPSELDTQEAINAIATGKPFWGTKLLGISTGRGFRAPKGLRGCQGIPERGRSVVVGVAIPSSRGSWCLTRLSVGSLLRHNKADNIITL